MLNFWDYIVKFVCIGDLGCGKLFFIICFCEGCFFVYYDVIIGVEFGFCIVFVGFLYFKFEIFFVVSIEFLLELNLEDRLVMLVIDGFLVFFCC